MKLLVHITILPALTCLVMSAGCNTDQLWGDRQKVEGPVTELDSPEGIELPDIQIADATEVDLVEDTLMHRAMYHRHLKALHEYYREHGYEQKRRWAEAELRAVERIQPFRYLLTAEVPAEKLKPTESIAAADSMYERARELMREGGHGVPALYREEIMLKARALFVDLIRTYPSSDKIDDAAFYCGEIHKEYLKDQEPIAVQWYERAYTWDPDTPHPARFQAAVTYDYRLHDRARALELYRQVIDLENRNKSNVSYAVMRIDELTRSGQAAAESEERKAVPTAAESPAPIEPRG
jgi:hypothetical protein